MDDRHSMRDVLAVVLAGGAGERLYPLTRNEAKPAVHFGGMYRIIDFTLSNCINSQIRKILVLVQYKSLSLIRHIHAAWNLSYPEWGEFIEVIPAQKRTGDNWYLGTADAIYQNLYSIQPIESREVMVLSGDHIYKMDYQKMVKYHRAQGAAVTLAALEVPLNEAHRFGILEVDANNQVTGFQEKPEHPRPSPHNPNTAMASMGVYVFDKDTLIRACYDDAERMSSHDFGKDIIPRLIETDPVFVYPFVDENRKEAKYWRDVGTLEPQHMGWPLSGVAPRSDAAIQAMHSDTVNGWTRSRGVTRSALAAGHPGPGRLQLDDPLKLFGQPLDARLRDAGAVLPAQSKILVLEKGVDLERHVLLERVR